MQFKSSILLASLGLSALLYGTSPAAAQAPSLGTAQDFAVLGASTVTNAGATAVSGDVGVAPGTAISGFPPGTMTGAIHAGDAVALQAQSDLTTAYNALTGAACTSVLTGMDLGGLTLTPGVYCFAASAPLNGVLTLDAQGNANAVFIFQIGSTLLPAINSSVQVINGAQDANVFWQVGSSATLAAGVAFKGNIVALASITLSAGSSLSGRALARTGAVTMDVTSVSVPSVGGCGTSASVVDIAPGCGPQAPTLACTPPIIGQPMTFSVSGSQPLKQATVLATPIGVPLSTAFGCSGYFDAASTKVLMRFVTSASGTNVGIRLPVNANLCGTQWTLQTLVHSSRSQMSVSNTLLLTLGS